MRPIVIALALIVTLTAPPAAAQQPLPIPPSIDLGTFGFEFAFPTAINNRGEVVGAAFNANGSVAFLWSRRKGFQVIGSRVSAVDINDRGQVVGTISTCEPGGTCTSSGFVWTERGGFITLGRFAPAAINNSGEIAGNCPDPVRACVWRRGVVRPIAGPNTFASGINDKGDVAGGSFDPEEGPLNAFVISRRGKITDLGPGVADDINNRGDVSGWESGIDSSAAMWVKGLLVPLGGEPSSTAAINASGWVLVNGEGFASAINRRRRRGVALAPEGAAEAIDINDRGEIVGLADVGSGVAHIVIWRLDDAR
jgi:uncharacterized membrane protein